MEITVVVEKILAAQQFTKKDGTVMNRYSFIGVTNTGKYDKKLKFEVVGDETWQRMAIVQGQTYVVSFDAESRSYNSPTKGEMWCTSLTAWRAALPQQVAYQQPMPAPMPQPQPYYQQQQVQPYPQQYAQPQQPMPPAPTNVPF